MHLWHMTLARRARAASISVCLATGEAGERSWIEGEGTGTEETGILIGSLQPAMEQFPSVFWKDCLLKVEVS